MEPRYLRNIPALSEAECQLLQQKRVAVVGCGGLGGHIIELLCRIGVGYLRVIDPDIFEETNFNRQLLLEQSLLGTSKAQAAKLRAQRINPQITVEPVVATLAADNALDLIADCDLVLDALDGISARRTLAAASSQANIPYVYGAISGWVAQAAVSMPGDELLDALYLSSTAIHDKSVLSFTPALCASIQTALAVKLLVHRPVESGVLYYVDLLHQEFEAIPLIQPH